MKVRSLFASIPPPIAVAIGALFAVVLTLLGAIWLPDLRITSAPVAFAAMFAPLVLFAVPGLRSSFQPLYWLFEESAAVRRAWLAFYIGSTLVCAVCLVSFANFVTYHPEVIFRVDYAASSLARFYYGQFPALSLVAMFTLAVTSTARKNEKSAGVPPAAPTSRYPHLRLMFL